MPGTVITFYSYKGGVGRSFTLANIAVLLARWGNRVLCVDWDLEAPGLADYFRPLLAADPASGVVDLVDDFVSGRPDPGAHRTRLTGEGTLDLIAAGRADPDYVGRVQRIDWAGLYEDGFGEYLEQCRARWTEEYDYVLLDSRTGVSDIGGICTAHLPDRLVVLFTANLQSVRGAVEIAERANAARDRLPYDRPQLPVLPVLSRFDSREEYARAEEWRRICLEETKGLYHNWLHGDVTPDQMARYLTLPYVSFWTFGEQLPVRTEPEPAPDQVSFALETVAAVIASHFDRADLLTENRDAYVASVRASRREFPHELRVSTPRSLLGVAQELVAELTAFGARAQLSLSGDRSLLQRGEDDARHLCLLVDGKVNRWQATEAELFLHRTLGQDRRVLPVLAGDADARDLPGSFGNLRYLRLGTGGPAELAREIAGQLDGSGEDDASAVLRRASRATLRPLLWELVDEIVRALGDADQEQARELIGDLALVVKRTGRGVPAPASTRAAIERALRATEEGEPG
ncbi:MULTISPECIES: KGGVGR-motif variant AAA ATPase [Amycolatopsis]|uniref:CobQ/CobB/MinD/ParA nucleotide binding domain-containing protein n=2 Tax=Amycolatopsis TaxID=1813 RepID=A0A1I3VM59_9PSEU|nr:AAA family ATPase [Amycolatopsis sacchari]SFJ96073.1 CobQ/CobB/MinD/ParA nucleotide binding domain-containing protein [Amycolatopsis sacchari]